MKEFTFEDIKEYIYSQPDEKEVNFGNIHNDDNECGCLMVQFGQYHNIDFDICDWGGVELHKQGVSTRTLKIVDAPWKEDGICHYFVLKDNENVPYMATTYKELKEVLKNNGH